MTLHLDYYKTHKVFIAMLLAMKQQLYDEIWKTNALLPNGRPLPHIFNFKQELLGASIKRVNRLIPDHVRKQTNLQFS